ncbi:MAG: F0F1 ATP synthase subunit epsilon [Gemmatimonadota bacterium]|nr:MAG: F0F1 ATP synthase subunit epsilon [Gemmatimonadota bacterium]
MSEKTLSVRVVSAEEAVYEGAAASVVAPAWDGRVGILPGHAPMIALLGHGELAIDELGGGSQTFYVAAGVIKVEGNEVTVLTEYAGSGPPVEIPEAAKLSPEDVEETVTEGKSG